MTLIVDWTLNIKTISELNCNQNPFVRSARHRLQKKIVRAKWNVHHTKITPPCKVILTRISPRELDVGDNLPASMKYIRDQLAELIHPGAGAGQGDGNKSGITWEYDQIKGKPQQVKIEIYV